MEQKGSFVTDSWLGVGAGIISREASDLAGVAWGVEAEHQSPGYSNSLIKGPIQIYIYSGPGPEKQSSCHLLLLSMLCRSGVSLLLFRYGVMQKNKERVSL